ncbi:MAG: hypothetical protein ACM3PS_10805 [Syntrophothermus sp.]
MSRKRPFGVTLFVWMVLCLSAWGMLRLIAALRWWDVLDQFGARLGPLYLAITGAGWAVAGVVLIGSVWAGKRWAFLVIPLSVFLWLAEYWLERIFFQDPRANLPFMIYFSIALSAVTLIIAFNRNTREFLLKSEEHEQPDQDPKSA